MSQTVRTTMRPDEEIEVGDAEFLDLKRQGLLVKESAKLPDPPAATAAPASPAPVAPDKKTSTAKSS